MSRINATRPPPMIALNGCGWATSDRLQGAPDQWPESSSGTNSSVDGSSPGSACSVWSRGGELGGALSCNPNCLMIFSVIGRSRIAAMIFSSPLQFAAVLQVEIEDWLNQAWSRRARRLSLSTTCPTALGGARSLASANLRFLGRLHGLRAAPRSAASAWPT